VLHVGAIAVAMALCRTGTESRCIEAPSPAELQAAVLAILRALDTNYPFPDLMVGSAVNIKLGLAGTVRE
jgi:hypothetical protein